MQDLDFWRWTLEILCWHRRGSACMYMWMYEQEKQDAGDKCREWNEYNCGRVQKEYMLGTGRSRWRAWVFSQQVQDKTFTVTEDMLLQPGLKMVLTDGLKCKICLQTLMKPPIILAKSCKSILECQASVDGWYAERKRKNYVRRVDHLAGSLRQWNYWIGC